ncbi:hypothetical protein [Waddlia chondrophila]|uniref:hypothetical protein n=1 Tax=Waddlia chondrophila TaxID=71667 RepID=UPI0005A55854|nr:hypothetical protein [Waddlia chondrophila]
MSIQSICKHIEQSICTHIERPHAALPGIAACKWRDENVGVIRKVATGAALACSGLACFVDTVGSLALAILTSPLKLAGITFADSFFIRALGSGFCGGMFLTVAQYDNIVADSIRDAIGERINAFF